MTSKLTGPSKYLQMLTDGYIPASQARLDALYETPTGRKLVIYTPSTTPHRLLASGCGRGVPYRRLPDTESYNIPVYGWLPPDYPLRAIGPRPRKGDGDGCNGEGRDKQEGV